MPQDPAYDASCILNNQPIVMYLRIVCSPDEETFIPNHEHAEIMGNSKSFIDYSISLHSLKMTPRGTISIPVTYLLLMANSACLTLSENMFT
jgi:hypothetical protein